MADEELAVQLVVEGMQKFLSEMKTADSAVGDSAKGWGKFGDVAAKGFDSFQSVGKVALGAIVAGAAAATAAIGAVGGAIVKLTLDAAPLPGIGDAFAAMGNKFGVSLESMQQAAGGTISDFELMRMANVALTGAGEDFGREFGQNLPKLLEAARAAAKATGQDVGFLFNSLVTGIKRGSPLLIDNTGLVLKVSEANQAMADQLGKTVEELTAEEKQIALLNATIEAGDAMVASFGGGQATAAEQIANFRTQIQNAKDQIGLAFLPVLQEILTPILALGQEYLPIAIEAVGKFAGVLTLFIDAVKGGADPLNAFTTALLMLGVPPEVILSIEDVVAWIQNFITKAQEALAPILAWIGENVELQDILIVLAGAIASVIIPAIGSFLAAVAPVAGVILAAVAVVAAMRQAWEANFLGIQEITAGVMAAIQGVISAIMLAIQGDWDGAWQAIQQAAVDIWEALKMLVVNSLEAIAGIFGSSLAEIGTQWRTNWELLVQIVTTIWSRIKTAVSDAIQTIKDFFANADWGAIGKNIITGIANGISAAAGAIADAAKSAAQAALNAAKDFLGIHSPSSVFREQVGKNMGAGIAAGIADLAPTINAQVRAVTAPAGMGGGNNQSMSITNNYNLTTNALTRPGGLALEFAAMEMGSR